MFFHSHHRFGQAGFGVWGLREWSETQGQYHLGGELPLYQPYNALIGE